MTKYNKLKELGNEQLSCGKLEEAEASYTAALEFANEDEKYILYSNRSAAKVKAKNFAGGLSDAEECLKHNPTFLKGYGRKCVALSLMEDWAGVARCFCEVASAAAVFPETNENSWNLLRDLKTMASRQLIIAAMRRSWKGRVDDALGGYEQIFTFVDERTVEVIVMNRKIEASYRLEVPREPRPNAFGPPPEIAPISFDLLMTEGGQAETASVPYIIRLGTPTAGGEFVEYRGDEALPRPTRGPSEVEESSTTSVDLVLDLCCPLPFISMDRASSFSGAGFVRMFPVSDEEAADKSSADPAYLRMSLKNIFLSYFKELRAFEVEAPLLRPDGNDSTDSAKAKFVAFMKAQCRMLDVIKRFPEHVAYIGEILLKLDDTEATSSLPSTDLAFVRGFQVYAVDEELRNEIRNTQKHLQANEVTLLTLSACPDTGPVLLPPVLDADPGRTKQATTAAPAVAVAETKPEVCPSAPDISTRLSHLRPALLEIQTALDCAAPWISSWGFALVVGAGVLAVSSVALSRRASPGR